MRKSIEVKITSNGITRTESFRFIVRGKYYIVRCLGKFTKEENKITKNNTEYEVLI